MGKQGQAAPPAGHTGAQNTRACIDWFSCTLPYDAGPSFIASQGLELTALDHGQYGYTQGAVTLDGALVLWHPERQEMGYHFSVNGRSLCLLDVRRFMQAAIDAGGKPTRLDVAMDDRAGLLDWDTIEAAVRAVHLTSRWKGAKCSDDIDFGSGGKEDGRIIRFGSRKSRASGRLYDKQLERIAAGADDPGPWLRFEVEFHDEDAEAITRQALAGEWDTIMGVIAGYLSFREPNGDSNRSRWPVAAWWNRFMGEVAKIKGLFSQELRRTIEDVKRWLGRQVAPSLALFLAASGGDIEPVMQLASEGRARWKPRHRAILAGALAGA